MNPKIVELALKKQRLQLQAAAQRVRILHVAGRPTHDTRALRQWLKSNASADIVAFFILRTSSDNPNARQGMALP